MLGYESETDEISTSSENDSLDDVNEVAYLVIRGEARILDPGEIKIGRDVNACSLAIHNKSLSKLHAVIESEGPNDTYIHDLSSRNGTKIGKVTLRPHVRYKLSNNDTIKFGNEVTKYVVKDLDVSTTVCGQTKVNNLCDLNDSIFEKANQCEYSITSNVAEPVFKTPPQPLKLKLREQSVGQKKLNVSLPQDGHSENSKFNEDDIFDQPTQYFVPSEVSNVSIDSAIFDAPTQCPVDLNESIYDAPTQVQAHGKSSPILSDNDIFDLETQPLANGLVKAIDCKQETGHLDETPNLLNDGEDEVLCMLMARDSPTAPCRNIVKQEVKSIPKDVADELFLAETQVPCSNNSSATEIYSDPDMESYMATTQIDPTQVEATSKEEDAITQPYVVESPERPRQDDDNDDDDDDDGDSTQLYPWDEAEINIPVRLRVRKGKVLEDDVLTQSPKCVDEAQTRNLVISSSGESGSEEQGPVSLKVKKGKILDDDVVTQPRKVINEDQLKNNVITSSLESDGDIEDCVSPPKIDSEDNDKSAQWHMHISESSDETDVEEEVLRSAMGREGQLVEDDIPTQLYVPSQAVSNGNGTAESPSLIPAEGGIQIEEMSPLTSPGGCNLSQSPIIICESDETDCEGGGGGSMVGVQPAASRSPRLVLSGSDTDCEDLKQSPEQQPIVKQKKRSQVLSDSDTSDGGGVSGRPNVTPAVEPQAFSKIDPMDCDSPSLSFTQELLGPLSLEMPPTQDFQRAIEDRTAEQRTPSPPEARTLSPSTPHGINDRQSQIKYLLVNTRVLQSPTAKGSRLNPFSPLKRPADRDPESSPPSKQQKGPKEPMWKVQLKMQNEGRVSTRKRVVQPSCSDTLQQPAKRGRRKTVCDERILKHLCETIEGVVHNAGLVNETKAVVEPEPVPSTSGVEVARSFKVLFTAYGTAEEKVRLVALGASIVIDPRQADVVVTDKIRRTFKFLAAVALGLPIVAPSWVAECSRAGRLVEPSDFMLRDTQGEVTWSFQLRDSINSWKAAKLLAGYSVFATQNVKPPLPELLSIVELCGGTPLHSKPNIWPDNTVVLSCMEDQNAWPLAKYRYVDVVHYEFLLTGVLRHKLDWKFFKLRQ